MALTDAKLRALKGKSAPYKIADAEGLYVLVSPTGSRMWRLAYRFLGKQKTLALGQYPSMSLLEVRRAREAAKRLLAEGIALAAQAGLDQEPSVRVVRFILDGKPAPAEEDEKAARHDRAMNEIERLESFALLASALATDLRQQLDGGSYVHVSSILDAEAEVDEDEEDQDTP